MKLQDLNWSKTIHLIFSLFFIQVICAQNQKLENGDLLFININCGPMCDAINAVTEGFESNDFNHMGMVIAENNEYFVYEAIGKAVVKTPLKTFVSYTKEPIYLGKLKNEYQYLIPDAIAFSEKQLGVPYDNDFIYNNEKYYCSELIYDAFLFANNDKPFFKLFPMTYKEPNSDNFFPIWVEHFKKQNIEIPEGKPGCNPGGMSLDDKIILQVYKL
ncbi:YiiX/YebB-like N1pC/P60 family cysteine hydrolase [Flavobacterium sp. I3-2]|uniref:YiiX/YebB-like N1pC/P60 family cysteine hydrolase n=1 Tax=Flavobacterium sp. I3-2 TaxID=2748319 RepID=UPI0015A77D04|nr:YiiX/YebB-like N1pC/P60 family cysteine hydrolase [Flavobacterium sp. I3-2]